MFSLYAIVPIVIVIAATYVFNHKLTDDSNSVKLLYFGLEMLAIVALTYLLFLFGFLPNVFVVILLIVLTFVSLLTLYLFTLHYYDNYYDQLAVVGNALLFFIKTVLAFYVFLTIFRYQPAVAQISLAVALTGILFIVSLFLEKYILTTINNVLQYLTNFDRYEFVAIPTLLILVAIFLFQAPTQQTAQVLNMNNHIRYLAFYSDIPNDVNVNFEQDELMRYEVDDLRSFARDYYYDDDYIYLYTADNERSAFVNGVLIILDRTTGEVVYRELTLDQPFTNIGPDAYYPFEAQQQFIPFNDELLFFATDGIYRLDDATPIKLSPLTVMESKYFFENGELYFIVATDFRTHEVYHYDGTDITLSETISLDAEVISRLEVVNAHLMYYQDGQIYLRSNPTILYDPSSDTYFADGEGGYIHHYDTIYEPNTELFYRYDYFEEHHQLLEVYDKNKDIYGFFYHTALHRWLITQSYDTATDIEYRIFDGNLEFMLVSLQGDTTTFTMYRMLHQDSALDLPFYSHFSLTTFIVVIVSIFIPFFNNEKYYTYIDFDSVLRRDKTKENK